MLLWSLNEAAKQLGNISVRTLRRLIDRGELGTVRMGRRRFVRPQDAMDWVERNVIGVHTPCCAGPGVRTKEINARHTDAKIVPFGGCHTPTQAAEELGGLLGLKTEEKRTR